MTAEYSVYSTVVNYLINTGWTIVCACPPVGTDLRFQKCNLPRAGGARGTRDEIDITAYKAGICLLIECKNSWASSIGRPNRDGETDAAKLGRISTAFTPSSLSTALMQAHGFAQTVTSIVTGLAYTGEHPVNSDEVDATFALHDGRIRWATSSAALRLALTAD